MATNTIILLLFIAALIGLGGFGAAYFFFRNREKKRAQESGNDDKNGALLGILEALQARQSELTGKISQLTQGQESARGAVSTQLTEMMKSVNENLKESREKTAQSLGALGERLVAIDKAQEELGSLSTQVVGLQQILDNKQARGAFGEAQLGDIVRDGLPESAFSLQHTLSNGKRADCLIRLPNPPGPIVIDSKFPLEAFQKIHAASDEAGEKLALAQLGADTLKHAKAIAEKYIVAGETADAALMFLPSESVFSELHLRLPQVIDKCRNLRVYPVSPNTMALTLNTVRAIMRDVKMREQAHLIQKEVRELMLDVGRLTKRVGSLRTHFRQAGEDIDDIDKSTGKIGKRGDKIADIETLAPGEAPPEAPEQVEQSASAADVARETLTS